MRKACGESCVFLWVILFAMPVMANDIGIEVGPPGYLVCSLPEETETALGATCDEYIVRWEPIKDIYQYQINVIKHAKILDRNSMAIAPAAGYVSGERISDGPGKEYHVPLSITRSMQLEGNCTQVDIAPLISELREDHDLIETKACYLVITIIPSSGKPVIQLFALPMEGEA